MKAFRGAILSVCVAAGLAGLWGCGNALEDGSDPSGSIIRVVNVAPDPTDAFTPDIIIGLCSGPDADREEWEPAPISYALVQMRNDSRPNTPQGQSTNSFVTMSRYRVDYTGSINGVPVTIPSYDEGGMTVGIAPDGTGTMRVLVMGTKTLDYIQNYYPTVGVEQGLTLRATITISGKDAFQVNVETSAEVVLEINNYDRCS